MPVERTPLHNWISKGTFQLPDTIQMLKELHLFIQNLELKSTIFRSNHASNYVPIGGRLPRDREGMLAQIDAALTGEAPIRPEGYRGL